MLWIVELSFVFSEQVDGFLSLARGQQFGDVQREKAGILLQIFVFVYRAEILVKV